MFKLERIPGRPFFNPISVKEYKVSIQASDNHYCEPRITSDNSDDYLNFEVAILDSQGEFMVPIKHNKYMNYTWAGYWNSYDDVAAYVPRYEVELLLQDLSKE